METSQPTGPSRHVEPDRFVDALVQASFLTMAVLSRVAAENDLSLTQLRVFAILRDRRLRMAGLADYLGLEKSTMTGLVARAEKRGLLERAASSEDRRAVEVFLSPAGADLTERLYAEVVRSLSPMTAALGVADQRRVGALLERMLGTSAA